MLNKSWLHIKRNWLPYIIAYSAKMVMKILVKTCRIKIHGLDTFISTAEKSPCMLMLWHGSMILVPEVISTHASQFMYTAFISKSRDGNPLTILTESYACARVLRVPHNARHLALSQLISCIKNKGEIIVITPDGPRGPRHVVKPGIILAARETEANIFPFSWKAKSFWQLKTWDRMKIPKPFTSIEVTFGEPIFLSKENSQDYETDASYLKEILNTN